MQINPKQSIIQQFDNLWTSIQNTKSGQSQKAAEAALENFLKNPANYEDLLEAMNQVGDSPDCYAKGPQDDLHALFLALQTGNIDDIDEWGQDVNWWTGMTLAQKDGQWVLIPISPEEILNMFKMIEEAYVKDPTFRGNQEELAWILNSKYAAIISKLSSDPEKFKEEAAELQIDLKNGNSDKVKRDLGQLMELLIGQAAR